MDVQIFVISFIISASIVALIASSVLHSVQQAQEPSDVDLKPSPEEKLRQIYRSAYITDLSLRDEAASKAGH